MAEESKEERTLTTGLDEATWNEFSDGTDHDRAQMDAMQGGESPATPPVEDSNVFRPEAGGAAGDDPDAVWNGLNDAQRTALRTIRDENARLHHENRSNRGRLAAMVATPPPPAADGDGGAVNDVGQYLETEEWRTLRDEFGDRRTSPAHRSGWSRPSPGSTRDTARRSCTWRQRRPTSISDSPDGNDGSARERFVCRGRQRTIRRAAGSSRAGPAGSGWPDSGRGEARWSGTAR